MIEVQDVMARAGGFALTSVSFTIPTGQYGFLMGKTGSGKTTLLEAICGLRPVLQGRIALMDNDVTHLKPAARGVGYVPQDGALFPSMSVRDHLAFALTVRKWDRAAIDARVRELAGMLQLDSLLHRRPKGLSGGEAQRVALGRALACHPQVLCLDEPLSALDDETRAEMCEILRMVRDRTGVTVLHVTHNLEEARRLADVLFVLRDGQVRESELTH
jgi:molybdate/tungstate transport system ATP-binding protein